MTKKNEQIGNSRRDFLKNSAMLASLLAMKPISSYSYFNEQENGKVRQGKMHGIQIGAVSFVDEGVENVLDFLQKEVNINTLFITVFTYGRGLAGRQIPGHPMPDHGSQVSDESTYHGGIMRCRIQSFMPAQF